MKIFRSVLLARLLGNVPPGIRRRARGMRMLAGLALLVLFSAEAQAPVDARVALVIGNAAYPSARLPNPANDARAMAEALRGAGFSVIEVRDATRAQMADAVIRVREALKEKGGVGMLYYAGHGLQLEWRNYMVPVDAALRNAADVPLQTVECNRSSTPSRRPATA
jgi:hypothetical protein